jgi:lipopolysaccharide/colanic/teichoic acid biosynthesis glycosyltransferase
MLIIAGLIRLTSRGRAIFAQERVGRKGRLFRIYKFRSMTEARERHGPGLTRAGDSRVTGIGRIMRKLKIDEIPQFYNVLRGDMSLVGPRPKLPQYSPTVQMSYRPGITGPATLVFRNEEEIMRGVAAHQLDEFYAEHIKPVKTRIDTCYMCKATPLSDLSIVHETLLGCMRPLAVRQSSSVGPSLRKARPGAVLRAAPKEASSSEGA